MTTWRQCALPVHRRQKRWTISSSSLSTPYRRSVRGTGSPFARAATRHLRPWATEGVPRAREEQEDVDAYADVEAAAARRKGVSAANARAIGSCAPLAMEGGRRTRSPRREPSPIPFVHTQHTARLASSIDLLPFLAKAAMELAPSVVTKSVRRYARRITKSARCVLATPLSYYTKFRLKSLWMTWKSRRRGDGSSGGGASIFDRDG